jgi:predicted metal-dependent phosphotriesterase family hydrolase
MTRREALTVLAASAVSPGRAAGAIIRTVLKDLPPESLTGGATLFHEHLSLAPDFMPKWIALARGQIQPPAQAPPSDHPYFMRDLDLMVEEVGAAGKEGVACIVDGGHPDMGRDLDFLKQLSMQSGMPIVAGCGYYSQPFYPPEIAAMTEDQITRELVRQARTQPVGAFGEIGSWDELTDLERKVFRAVGKAHLETNLPIFTLNGFP